MGSPCLSEYLMLDPAREAVVRSVLLQGSSWSYHWIWLTVITENTCGRQFCLDFSFTLLASVLKKMSNIKMIKKNTWWRNQKFAHTCFWSLNYHQLNFIVNEHWHNRPFMTTVVDIRLVSSFFFLKAKCSCAPIYSLICSHSELGAHIWQVTQDESIH